MQRENEPNERKYVYRGNVERQHASDKLDHSVKFVTLKFLDVEIASTNMEIPDMASKKNYHFLIPLLHLTHVEIQSLALCQRIPS